MDAIRIQNLRCFKDTDHIELKPITMLLGQNSSGKSTFLRFIPLLRQSIETVTTGPILWYGRYVDFGSFKESLRRSSDTSSDITFHFKLKLSRSSIRYGSVSAFRNTLGMLKAGTGVELGLRLGDSARLSSTRYKSCSLRLCGEHTVNITIDNEDKVTKFIVNTIDLTQYSESLRVIRREGLVPLIIDQSRHPLHLEEDFNTNYKYNGFLSTGLDIMKSLTHKSTKIDTLFKIFSNIPLASTKEMLSSIQSASNILESWRKSVEEWNVDNQNFIQLRDLVIANYCSDVLHSCDRQIASLASNSRYIAPVRATAERYYRLQDLAVNEVDFQGQNLAMFLQSLTKTEQQQYNSWTERLLGFSTNVTGTAGHISINLKEVNSKEEFNLADKGFGFSQVLPILTQLWAIIYRVGRSGRMIRDNPVVFAIEQPELHLHPRLQAQLLDVFVYSIKEARNRRVDLRLLIETHSEVMINRLGHNIAAEELKPQDANILVFERRSNDDPTNVRTASFDQKGYLKNWPFGFFEPE